MEYEKQGTYGFGGTQNDIGSFEGFSANSVFVPLSFKVISDQFLT
jgi:hypothetical protein